MFPPSDYCTKGLEGLTITLHRNAIDLFWLIRLGQPSRSESLDLIRSFLPIEGFPEEWEFTLLHKTVLKLNDLDLRNVLMNLSKKDINARDIGGRTALWWATNRSDVSALSLLIQHGADINIQSKRGSSPLAMALYRSQDCTMALLNANADATVTDDEGWSALHKASYYGAPITVLEQIILQDAEINRVVPGLDYTALLFAAQKGHTTVCEHLILHKADINATNHDGECALHLALSNKQSVMIRLLLTHGAYHHLKTKAGESLLHYMAMYGDADCLEALRSDSLNGINPEDTIESRSPIHVSKDLVGRTAEQIAEQRSDVTPAWHEAFHQLMQAIKTVNESAIDGRALQSQGPRVADNTSNAEEVDNFEDALEHQEFGHQAQQPPLPVNQSGCARSRTF